MLPRQRGNVKIDPLTFLCVLQYMAANGCRWRSLPNAFGNWFTIYRRFRYWIARGIFDLIEKELQSQSISIKGIQALALDSTSIQVHPDGTGAPKKGPQAIGKSRGGRTTKIHGIVSGIDQPIVRCLSPGSASDDPEGQKVMTQVPKKIRRGKPLLMDKAYEGDACRAKVIACGRRPVVPPKSNRKKPWKYKKKLYKKRDIVECYFRSIKQCRQVFTR